MTNATRKPRISQSEMTKALRAARDSGHNVQRVEIEPGGRVVVIMGEPEQTAVSSIDVELSRILERRQ
ncbi:MAG TPA: hypothetical protein VIF40_16230 [Methylosinus sp.]|jgi:hypothetical protein|uniref:hypothetical protein n=1 Tax=Methylosinus sp. TaxID=427 RepID=UPI002F9345EB